MSDGLGLRTGSAARGPGAILAVVLAVRLVAAVLLIADARANQVEDPDVQRAERIVTSPARPYRDFPVEYMPLETVILFAVAGDGFAATATRIVLLSCIADLATAAAVAYGWGRRPALVYLLLGLPMMGFAYLRFDFVPVALAAWAMAFLARHDDDPRAGVAFGLAILAKLWPIVLLPVLLLRRARRAAVWSAGVLATGGLLWAWRGGVKAPFQVLSFRGATGWANESVVGNLVWTIGRGQIYVQAGAARIGTAPQWAKALLGLLLLATLTAVWHRASRSREDLAGAPALVAVLALLVCSPLFSTQYVVWLLPWAAIAFEGRAEARRVATLAAVVVALTGLIHLSYLNLSPLTNVAEKLGLLVRNMVCVWIVASWTLDLSGRVLPRVRRTARV
jgi:hypothetical protein